jgi:hypothetical protein
VLPFRAQPLSKHDLNTYKKLFALYLDVQKELCLEELDEKEVKGRWKSFLGKWNRGELAEGWYDPKTKQRTDNATANERLSEREPRHSPGYEYKQRASGVNDGPHRDQEEDSENDEFGPAPPIQNQSSAKAGPTVPNAQDLELVAELRAEDLSLARADLAHARKADRKLQKERLEELVPRPDPGSRERQLEKKREVAATNAGFREAKEGGDVEIGDGELMGDDGIEGLKRRKAEVERKKNERELRKEELLRARQAEREERSRKAREKEEKTMEYLKALAKERFG